MKNMKRLLILLFLSIAFTGIGQRGNQNEEPEWTASWLTMGDVDAEAAGLYLFRKSFNLQSVPEDFKIRISADNKYKLFVNGTLTSVGPNWGDIKHWNYQTVDISKNLKSGNNLVAIQVWNEADLRPVAQFSFKTALMVQGEGEAAKVLNTDDSWKVTQDNSYTPLEQHVSGYYAAGAGDFIDFNKSAGDWKSQNFDDSSWKSAKTVFEAMAQGFGFRQRDGWNLVPTILPEMELSNERLESVRRTEGVKTPKTFPATPVSFEIKANTTAKILLDQGHLTNAYLNLEFSGGKNSVITLSYAEGLFDAEGAKGNRDIVEGKTINGRRDSIISSGHNNQEFSTLTYRTYRYVEMEIDTKDEPLVIEDIHGTFTGYPFEMNANLRSEDDELSQIMDIGWRTARLCAVDTYMDCPYYERLQYVGDTRIQHFVSFYNSGDDRLIKNALNLLDYSRQPNGYTLSRYPDRQNQVIPTYSLWYVSMLYDYMMYGTDEEFVKEKLMGTRQVMNYFITFLNEDGSLKNVPGWNYTDWVPQWRFGMAPSAEDGSSAAIDLQMLHALQSGIALEEELGRPEFEALYTKIADQLVNTINEKYWDASKQLYADTPEKKEYSQHVNSLAILAGLVDDESKKAIGKALLEDETLAPASIYFKYYLHLALNEAGYGDDYLNWLDIWRKNIELGLTTWGETSQVETTRSDCHAWGSSPNIEFFRIILGIESDAPGFAKVRIEPNLGELKEIGGSMPHPAGEISVNYKMKRNKLEAEIMLPEKLEGTFVWGGKEHSLNPGTNNLSL